MTLLMIGFILLVSICYVGVRTDLRLPARLKHVAMAALLTVGMATMMGLYRSEAECNTYQKYSWYWYWSRCVVWESSS